MNILLLLISLFNFSNNGSFLAPQDDPYLLAEFNQEAALNAILTNPDNAKVVAEFDEQFAEDFNTAKQYDVITTSNVDDWEMSLFDKRNKQMSFIKNHVTISPELSSFLQTEIKYNYWHLLLAYAINRSNANVDIKIVTSLPRVMTDALKQNEINNDELLISKSFRAFLPYYAIYYNSQEKGFLKYALGSKSLADKGNFAMERLKGNVLDFTLMELVDIGSNSLSTDSFRFWTSQIFSENLQKYLVEKHYAKILEQEEKLVKAEVEKSKKTKKSSLPNLVDLNDKSFTFEKYEGKVIYVDFWASWCGPCRKEFPYSKEMHESLSAKERKQIVFLYISTDQDLEAWKKAVEKLGLSEFGENAHSFEVGAAYKISSIPRYMIIDKKGNIVNPNAPRPSNPETLQELLKLL